MSCNYLTTKTTLINFHTLCLFLPKNWEDGSINIFNDSSFISLRSHLITFLVVLGINFLWHPSTLTLDHSWSNRIKTIHIMWISNKLECRHWGQRTSKISPGIPNHWPHLHYMYHYQGGLSLWKSFVALWTFKGVLLYSKRGLAPKITWPWYFRDPFGFHHATIWLNAWYL